MPEGFTELERELQRDPRSKKFLDLAREYQKAGRLSDALRVCESGLANNPNMAQARVLHAQLLLGSGDLQAASVSIQKALLVLPDNVAANHLAADIHWGLGDSGLALKHYQIVHLFDPSREGVAERIRSLTAPPPPEVVSTSDVDAILETAREPESGADFAPDGSPDELPVASEDLLGPEAQGAPEPVIPESPETVHSPEEQEILAGDLGLDLRGEVPAIPEEPTPEEPAGPVDTREVEVPQREEAALSEAEASESPEDIHGAPASDAFEGDLLGGGLLDLGETVEWPEQPPEALAPVRVEPEEAPVLTPKDRDSGTAPLRLAGSEAPGGPSGDSLSTLTLARLYEQQGYPEKAVEVYQRLLIRNPDDPQVLERIHGLRDQMERGAVEPEPVDQEEIRRALRQRSIRALNDWLRRMREERHVS